MPRLPVDGVKVIEHRITFGAKEREILESTTTAYSFRNVSTPIITAINDNTTLLLIAGLIGLVLPSWLPDDYETITEGLGFDGVKDWLEIQNLAGAGAGAYAGSVAGPVGAIIGAILGSYGVEVAEDVLDPQKQAVAATAALIVLKNTLNRLGRGISDIL